MSEPTYDEEMADLFSDAILAARQQAARHKGPDERPFSLLASELSAPEEVPANLMKLRRARNQLLNGKIGLGQFTAIVSQMLAKTTRAYQTTGLPSAPGRELEPEARALFQAAQEALANLQSGLKLLLVYARDLDEEDLLEGMETVEESMLEIRRTRLLAQQREADKAAHPT